MRVIGLDERKELKLGEITFFLSPLGYREKMYIGSAYSMESGEQKSNPVELGFLYVKYSLKDVKGLEGSDGPYKLSFDSSGNLTDKCTNEILSLSFNNEVIKECVKCASDFENYKYEGAEIDEKKSQVKKK